MARLVVHIDAAHDISQVFRPVVSFVPVPMVYLMALRDRPKKRNGDKAMNRYPLLLVSIESIYHDTPVARLEHVEPEENSVNVRKYPAVPRRGVAGLITWYRPESPWKRGAHQAGRSYATT